MQRRTFRALVSIGFSSCSGGVTPPPSDSPIPVVQSLLVVGSSRHVAWVEWATPADSLVRDEMRPVSPALVDLWLVPPSADSVRFQPMPGSPGGFEVLGLTIAPQREYRLGGTVNGVEVTARTRTPGVLQIFDPEADTIRVRQDCDLNCSLAFHWHAPGASAYEYSYGGSRAITGVVRETSGVLALPSSTGVSPFQVLAYNPEAVDFFVSSIVDGNVEGIFGAFAAASTAARVIAWE